jgi:hypothetical protein
MQREYGKAFSANQALAQETARMGELETRDIEGLDQRMGEFKDTVSAIRENYNNDLALAAPELARAVAKERQNPWYQKNKLYTQEFDRRQKLLDQFGPNILFSKDLPQGNLNNMNLEDIGFDYINRQHLFDMYNKQYGPLGKKPHDLGIVKDPDDSRYMRQGYRTGLTNDEVADLVNTQGEIYIDQAIENMGISDTPESRAMLKSEFENWAYNNLIGGEKYTRSLNPDYDPSPEGGPETMGGLEGLSNLVDKGPVNYTNLSDKDLRNAAKDLAGRIAVGEELSGYESSLVNLNPDIRKKIADNNPVQNVFQDPSQYPDIFSENLSQMQQYMLNNLGDLPKFSEEGVRDMLTDLGIATRVVTGKDVTGQGSIAYTVNGITYPYEEFKKLIQPLKNDYRKVVKYKNTDTYQEGLEELKNILGTSSAKSMFGIDDFKQDEVSGYILNSMLSGFDPEGLMSQGVSIERSMGDSVDKKKKTKSLLEEIFKPDSKVKIGAVNFFGMGTSLEESPYASVETSEGNLKIPFKGDLGMQHASKISVAVNDPRLITQVFNHNYKSRIGDNGASVEELFGIPKGTGGLSKVKRERRNINGNMQDVYIAPVKLGERTYELIANTPGELFGKVEDYLTTYDIKNSAGDPYRIPLVKYYVAQAQKEATAKDKKQAYISRAQEILNQ